MEYDANTINQYLSKIDSRGQSELLSRYALDFLEEIKNYPGKLHHRQMRISLAEVEDLPGIEKMVKLAYNWRYCDENGAKLTDFSEVSQDPKTKTLVVKVAAGDQSMILATCRLVRASHATDLEFYQFYKFGSGQTWEQYWVDRTPYEIERLAFHPVFELANYRPLQAKMIKEMYEVVKSLMPESNAWLGITARYNIKKFLDYVGIKLTPIPDLVFQKNNYTDFLVNLFPNYFKDFYAYELH